MNLLAFVNLPLWKFEKMRPSLRIVILISCKIIIIIEYIYISRCNFTRIKLKEIRFSENAVVLNISAFF